MRVLRQEFEHPTQASRVALNVFALPEGHLVTEEREGTTTVVSTLGTFPSQEAALAHAHARAAQLLQQQYRGVSAGAHA